jgi:hypothetical protein
MQQGFHDRLGAPLRETVGPEGRVVGVDYSQRMIARSRALVRDKGFPLCWRQSRQVASRATWGTREATAYAQSSASTQSKVRVTAFFHCL